MCPRFHGISNGYISIDIPMNLVVIHIKHKFDMDNHYISFNGKYPKFQMDNYSHQLIWILGQIESLGVTHHGP